jgi:hypothetical protein
MKAMTTEKVYIGVNSADGGAAAVTFAWGGKSYSKEIQPGAWKKVWEHFGGARVPNGQIKQLAEQWLESVLRTEDLSALVLDVPWVVDHLPASKA